MMAELGVILVNRREPLVRRNFDLAHELFHSLTWESIDGTVVASHIHEAPEGVAGPVVVPLFVDVSFSGTGSISDCVAGVSEELIKDIRQNPAEYYVNIHSTVFPAGAIRGQLSK